MKKIKMWIQLHREGVLAAGLALALWALYALTAAPGAIFGDPSEYQFIPAIWGIAHPPGYAFYTLLAGVWQRIFRVGSVSFRTNLLAGAAGAWTVSRVALMALEARRPMTEERPWFLAAWSAGIAGLALGIAPDVWQHSIHANAHIVSVALTMTQIWLLARWARDDDDRWLFTTAFFCGIGVMHHPITVWGLPAYALFILMRCPRLPLQPKTWLPCVGFGLLGLLPWLYFPLRSPHVPFGPTDMRSWAGFLRHATAQGLRVNLFHFGPADWPDRWRVFWSLLRLQYPWPLLALMLWGAVALARRKPRFALLWGLFLLGHLGFTLNSVQDVMAYLLHAFAALAVLIGVGAQEVMASLSRKWSAAVGGGLTLLLLGALIFTFPRISLREWREADAFVAHVTERFAGQGEHAALVSDWEHLTPYFYHTYVEGLEIDPADMRPVYATGSLPWTEAVFANLPRGPVYLTNYRRDVRELGFRLRPEGELWRVLEPPATDPAAPQVRLDDVWVDNRLELVGYDLPQTMAAQGEVLPLILYARAPTTETAILMPVGHLGEIEQRWTTDSRRLTPDLIPGEVIAERYEIFVPYTLPPGRYPLRLSYVDLSAGGETLPLSGDLAALTLGEIEVAAASHAPDAARVASRSLVNIGNDVALRSANVRAGLASRRGVWEAPLRLRPGQAFHLTLRWQVLQHPRASYTIFIHLVDGEGRLWLGRDYTPLGGAFPSYLWFPKWLPGQQVVDPYRLVAPENLPPGQYRLEVGMYEMSSVRRISQLDLSGEMTGDRFILGPIVVE